MTKKAFSLAGVAGLFIAVVLLAGCYAPLANQNGYLGLQISRSVPGAGQTSEIIVLVFNSDAEASLRETLWLIDKGKGPGLSTSEADRLTTLGKEIATSGLVKFGGFPFFQTTIGGTSGSFDIPGVPAGRSYFVKVFVFHPGFSFKVENIDKDFGNLILGQNPVFVSESYTIPFANWVRSVGQPVPVTAGETATINMAF